jgi:hypothetical protein
MSRLKAAIAIYGVIFGSMSDIWEGDCISWLCLTVDGSTTLLLHTDLQRDSASNTSTERASAYPRMMWCQLVVSSVW